MTDAFSRSEKTPKMSKIKPILDIVAGI